jgi:hypothetical protein
LASSRRSPLAISTARWSAAFRGVSVRLMGRSLPVEQTNYTVADQHIAGIHG